MSSTHKKPGLFIAIEGADGSGKTLMTQYFVERLQALGQDTLRTRELGGSPVAEKLRALIIGSDKSVAHEPVDIHASLLMVLASRIQHQRTTIFPAVAEGKMVVSDRCFDSTYVYQGRKNNILPMLEMLENMSEIRYLGNRPDYTIFMDVSPAVSMERTQEHDAKGDTFNVAGGLAERTADIQAYRDRMKEAHRTHPGTIIWINADASIEEVKAQLDTIAKGLVALRIQALSQEQETAEASA